MAHHIVAYGTHIFRDYIAATLKEGVCPRGEREADGGTRGCTVGDDAVEIGKTELARLTGGKHDVDDIVLYLLVDIDLTDNLLHIKNLRWFEDRHYRVERAFDILADDCLLLLF